MANRLKAYVKRTILSAAKEYAHPAKRRNAESTRNAFRDAMNGTDTGWWNDLIYTAPMLDMASRHRADIRAAIREYLAETGESAAERPARGENWTWGDIIAATAQRRTWDDYQGDNGKANEDEALALLWALRFAVEWFAGELAREYAPDL